MPIFEYSCKDCGHTFEVWVRTDDQDTVCPECESASVERLFSPPRVHGETSHDKSMRAAKKRDQDQARDRFYERKRYEDSHDRHGH